MKKVIKILLWGLCLTPLIIDKSVFFPYVAGENFFVRCLLVLAGLLFLISFFVLKEWRKEVIERTKKLIRNPLILSILAFVFILIVSTIFAVDKYTAFWGNIERGEGLVGFVYLFSFFVFSLFLFEKKDWLTFFKLNMFVSLVVLGREFIQFFSGMSRPGSFLENPTFLAGYLLFIIFFSITIFYETIQLEILRARKGNLSLTGWKYFSVLVFILSIFGIFITETRGTLAGLGLGFVAILIYFIFKKAGNFRKISIIILSVLIVFSAVFLATRRSDVWQKIPGVNRVAQVGIGDSTTSTRLLLEKTSLQAVNPVKNNLSKFLVGFGPDNYILAYEKYFNAVQFNFETTWFDRAHNELLDRLVMNGILGLLVYLLIWFFFFKTVLKKKNSPSLWGTLFLGMAFFVHLLFVFDLTITTILFFAIIGFILVETESSETKVVKKAEQIETSKGVMISNSIFFSVLVLFLIFVFLKNDLPEYFQMHQYFSFIKQGNPANFFNYENSLFEPFTAGQENIRDNLLVVTSQYHNTNNPEMLQLFNLATAEGEEYLAKKPQDVRFMIDLASAYGNKGKDINNLLYIGKCEQYFRTALSFSPDRPDLNYSLGLALLYEKKYGEAYIYFEKVASQTDSLYTKNNANLEKIMLGLNSVLKLNN